jgi:hypothetical protein
LLYVPKKAGGAKVKMGSVTAAITGTTVFGHVYQSGIVEFTVLEGSACIHLDKYGQAMYVAAGQRVTYDPMLQRLDNPVDVDIQEQMSFPCYRFSPPAKLSADRRGDCDTTYAVMTHWLVRSRHQAPYPERIS